jgi:gluconokinase
MTEKNCTIGIDIGTTSAKVLCLDQNGETITRAEERLRLISTEPGRAEQNPDHVYEAVTKLTAHAVETAKQKGFVPTLLGMSSAMHSLIAISEYDKPLTNAILWLDGRAGEEATAIWDSDDRSVYTHTGTPIHAMSPFVKLLWLKKNERDVFEKAKRFVSLKEWLWFRWFNEWCVDESIASATGLFNLTTRNWDEQALSLTDITAVQLSRIVPTAYTRAGLLDSHLLAAGLTSETRFNIGASDGVLANLAHGVTHRGAMVLTVGTSLAIRTGSDKPLTSESFRPFCYVLNHDKYIVGAPSNNGGILLDWLSREVFANEKALPPLCGDAEHVNTNDLYCIPHIAGERAPVWSESATASIVGLKLGHSQVQIMRAAIEGILFNAYAIGKDLIQLVGNPEYIVVSGKLFRHSWIRQFVADLFGIEVRFEEIMDASTIGAIMLALESNGGKLLAHSKQSSTNQIFATRSDPSSHAKLASRFSVYNQLFHAIAGIRTTTKQA